MTAKTYAHQLADSLDQVTKPGPVSAELRRLSDENEKMRAEWQDRDARLAEEYRSGFDGPPGAN